MLIPIESKLVMMSFKTTLGFILTLLHSFHVVLSDNLPFLPHPGKFSVVPNYLNFFIKDCAIDRERDCLSVWNSATTTCQFVEVNNSLSQVNTKLLCHPHSVIYVRLTMVILYAPHDILRWSCHKYSTE